MEQSKYDVFISYSRKDYVDEQKNVIPNNVVSKIKEVLSQEGISYWFDEEGIYSGQNFVEKIVTNIVASKILVFLSTANSNNSKYTCKEIASADEFGKHIIPVRIDSTPYNKKVLFRIADLDYIEYYSNPERGIVDLVSSIKTYLEELKMEEERQREIQKKEEEKKKLEEQRRLEDEKQKRILREQQIKREQEIIINDIELRCTQLNNEETKLELDRANLLLSTEKVMDLAIRNGLKVKIVESSPIKKKAEEKLKFTQEKLDEVISSRGEFEADNKKLNNLVSDLQTSLKTEREERAKCVELLEKSEVDREKVQKRLIKKEDELELAKQGVVKPNKKIHFIYIVVILLLLLGWYYTSKRNYGTNGSDVVPQLSIVSEQSNLLDDSIDVIIGRLSTIHPELQKCVDGYKNRNMKSTYQLAKYFESGEFLQGNRNTSIAGKLVHIAADGGYTEAQNKLGYYFFWGKANYRLNYDSAVTWYSKAIASGSIEALYNKALAYADGCYSGTHKSYLRTSEALDLYRESAEKGYSQSQLFMGKYCYDQGKYHEAKDWFEKSLNGDLGNKDKSVAQFYMGQLYGNIHLGIENRDYKKAFEWYMNSAENGHAKAAYYLGKYYQEGKGVEQNYSEAQKWFTIASNKGDTDAKKALEKKQIKRSTNRVKG